MKKSLVQTMQFRKFIRNAVGNIDFSDRFPYNEQY